MHTHLQLQDNRYIPTDRGVRIWNEVDQTTDQIFDKAFSGLSNVEMEELQGLMYEFSGMLRQVDNLKKIRKSALELRQ